MRLRDALALIVEDVSLPLLGATEEATRKDAVVEETLQADSSQWIPREKVENN
jgi:hypothetical protein